MTLTQTISFMVATLIVMCLFADWYFLNGGEDE